MLDESSPPPRISDAELLSRVGARESDAFEALHGRYVRPIFGLALRWLGDRRDAEDAVEEAFAAIWHSASTYRPQRGTPGGWVYTVARNAIVDRMRRQGFASEPGADEQTEESVAAWRVHRALEELRPREREALELAYWSGMSQGEVAGYLGLPPVEVGVRTRYALAHLAAVLEDGPP